MQIKVFIENNLTTQFSIVNIGMYNILVSFQERLFHF